MTRIFYNSLGTPDLYSLIRARMPDDLILKTLSTDSDDERRAAIADCEVAIVAAKPLTAPLIEAGRGLRLVHHQGVGFHDTVDVDALALRGIRLALTPEGTTVGVAEHAVLLMLATARHLAFADRELRQGRWHVNSLRTRSFEMRGKRVGFLGFGRIGRETALRLKAFGTVGQFHDPAVSLPAEELERHGVEPVSFERLLETSDIVSLHMPLVAATRHIVGPEAIARMKPGAIIVNTARGGLIDDDALATALASGHLAGAGLDVFEGEPLSPDHPLAALPNTVLTPHFSAGTRDAMARKMDALFANVQRYMRGEALHNEVPLQPPAATGTEP